MTNESETAVLKAEVANTISDMYSRHPKNEGPILLSDRELAVCLLLSRRSTETLSSTVKAYREANEDVRAVRGQVEQTA